MSYLNGYFPHNLKDFGNILRILGISSDSWANTLIVDELLDETVKYLTFMQARLNEMKSLVDEEGKQG